VLENEETKPEPYKVTKTKEDPLVDMLEIEVRVEDIHVNVDGGEAEHNELEAECKKNIKAVIAYESHGVKS